MTWEHIKEVAASDLATIGNHSHTHEYLIDWEDEKIKSDLITSIKIFEKELGYSPKIFSLSISFNCSLKISILIFVEGYLFSSNR